jgi:AraC-like DNA-binding protein
MASPTGRNVVPSFSGCFSTEGIDPTNQFAAWQKQLGLRFGFADISRKAVGPFRAAIETISVSKLSLSYLFADAMTVERTGRHVALRDHDDFTIGLLLEGRAVVEQDGRGTSLSPGEIVLCDGRRPFRVCFDEPFRQIVFQCDRAQLQARLPDADRRTARSIRGQAALPSVTADYVASIARQPMGFGGAESAIAQHVLDVLAFTLCGAAPREPTSRPLLTRIQAYIEENLSNSALTPTMIARHHRISRRLLYRLFEEIDDSVASFIRRRRLARCRAVLADDLYKKLGVSEIAFACGFNDATTFGRAFRAAFGMSPRDYRRSAYAGVVEKQRSPRSECRGLAAVMPELSAQPVCWKWSIALAPGRREGLAVTAACGKVQSS